MPVGRLIWDDDNEEHIARHGIDREDVEQAFYSSRVIERARNDTYRVVGQTDSGRYIAIFVAPRKGGEWYVVTARDADLREQRNFRRR
jgi:uncharacterized DUF497 family protein